MSINLQIKGNLENSINRAFNKLLAKKIVTDKKDFCYMMLDNAIAELYKSKTI